MTYLVRGLIILNGRWMSCCQPMRIRVAHVLILLCIKEHSCMWTAMTCKDGINLTLDPKSDPERKKAPQTWTEWCVFHRKSLTGRRYKSCYFYEKMFKGLSVLQFSIHLFVDPVYKISDTASLRHSPDTLFCQYCPFFVICLQYSGVWQS